MTILLALASAMVYGIADYCGGRASRTNPSVVVAFAGQTVSLCVLLVVVPLLGDPFPDAASMWWGAAGGGAGAIALIAFYYALAHGDMAVVAPTTGVVGVTLPVVVGLASGERPAAIAYVGIALAVAAVALVSGALGTHERTTRPAVLLAAATAGLGFGTLFVALDRTADDAGMWPLLATRWASVPILGLLVVITVRRRRRGGPAPDATAPIRVRPLGLAAIGGLLDNAANLLYLVATRGGMLSIVAVVSSLYPASTIGLAATLDREQIHRAQWVGLGVAGVAVVLVSLGRG